MKYLQVRAFTIVELLIVITVVGVLAGITVTQYAGVQQKAKTELGNVTARNILKKAEKYKVFTGQYPSSTAQFDEYSETKLGNASSLHISCTAWTSDTVATIPGASNGIGPGADGGRRVRACGGSTGGNGYYWDYKNGVEIVIPYGP
jgi:prepilin-type N-terminal cleavage/methylation domain-containing protein